jgi:E3 ubiquitin-protein ligase HERC4
MAYLETAFGSIACINGSFLLPNSAHFGCNTKTPGVDLKAAEEAFAMISRFENTSIKELVRSIFTMQWLSIFWY